MNMVKIVKKMEPPREKEKEITKVATEILFAKLLAGNNQRLRDRGIQRLRKWVKARSQSSNYFTQDDLMRIWKGLFYCMWMSDKPLVQEELAETISKLIHNFAEADGGILFARCFFLTMQTEWFGIDQLRLDKFLMLGRRFLRQTFLYCHHWKWKAEVTSALGEALSATILMVDTEGPNPMGFSLHIFEVFMEELAKVGRGQLPPKVITELVRPFVTFLGKVKDNGSNQQVVKHVFQHLIRQSELGQEFKEKFDAWKRAGFPGTSWQDMEMVEEPKGESPSEDEELMEMVEGPQDPRAGRVDVVLPQIDFDAAQISMLFQDERRNTFPGTNRRTLHGLADQFSQMAKGHYPLATDKGLKKMISEIDSQKGKVRKAASRLATFEVQLQREDEQLGCGRMTKKQRTELKRELKWRSSTVGAEEPQSKDKKKKKRGRGGRGGRGSLEDDSISGETRDNVAGKKNRVLKRKGPVQEEEIKMETDNILMSLEGSPAANLRKKKAKVESRNGILSSRPALGLNATPKVNNGKDIAATDPISPNAAQSVEVSAKEVRRITPTKIGPVSWKQNVEVEFEVSPGVFKKMKRIVPEMPTKSRLSGRKRSVIKGKGRNSSGVWEVEPCTPVGVAAVQNGRSPAMRPSTGTPSSGKRVNIVLMKNQAQATSEYLEAVKQSPGIPFDVTKKPAQGILKPSPCGSPINPFYNKALTRLSKIKF